MVSSVFSGLPDVVLASLACQAVTSSSIPALPTTTNPSSPPSYEAFTKTETLEETFGQNKKVCLENDSG